MDVSDEIFNILEAPVLSFVAIFQKMGLPLL